MIKVLINRLDEKIHSFRISGHANSGPYGYDLVCAGVSAVSFGAVNAALSMTSIELEVEQATDGGDLFIKINSHEPNADYENVQTIFEAMLISLQTIERDYKKFIRIKEVPL